MAEEAQVAIREVINFVLGDLAAWTRPVTLKSVGPAYPELFDIFEQELMALYSELEAMLRSRYDVSELPLVFPASQKNNPLLQEGGKFGSLARRIARIKARAPQDFAGGWSIRGKEVDLDHWRAISSYSIPEATLLSVGRDPRHTDFEALFRTYGRSDQADEMLYFLEDRQEQFARAFGHDPDDSEARIGAADFLRLVKQHRIRIDDRFRRMLKESWSQPDDAAQKIAHPMAADRKPPHRNSQKAYARLTTAVAIEKYGLSTQSEIPSIAKKMVQASELAGLRVDARLVKQLLRLGWSQLTDPDADQL